MEQPCGYAWDLSGANFVLELGATRYLYKSGKQVDLTRIELDILGFLISNANKIKKEEEIMNRVRSGLTVTSVPTHITNLRRKASLSGYIPNAKEVSGYMFRCTDLAPIYDTDDLSKAIQGELTIKGSPQSNYNADQPQEVRVPSPIVAAGPIEQTAARPEADVRASGVDIVSYLILAVGLGGVVGAIVSSVFARAIPWMEFMLIIAASIAYGALCAIDLALEGAYEFDTYSWRRLKKVYIALFLLNACALLIAANLLSLMQEWTHKDALLAAVSFLIAGSLVSCLSVFFILPNRPITVARFQTQSAFGAFCKNIIIYNLPLYSVFVLLPWALLHAGGELSRSLPFAAALLVVFLLVAIGSVIGTSYLSDRLVSHKRGQPYPYHGLFSTLLFIRTILMFLAPFIFVIFFVSQALSAR